MTAPILTRVGLDRRSSEARRGRLLLSLPLIGLMTGCIQVSAPEEPIEINLNINIRQEVVVRLQQDVRELIQENPGVF